jgi:uncharacterized protein (DUF58 family)
MMLGIGLLRPSLPLSLIGLTLLIWFAAQWLWFVVGLWSVRHLRVLREVRDDRSPVAVLWAGQSFEVHVWLIHDEKMPTPHVTAIDFVPFAVQLERQDPDCISAVAQGMVWPEVPLEWTYRIRCDSAGLARFEGVRVLLADWQGFFHAVHFVHSPVELPILPMLPPRAGQTASKKRNNLLLPPGIHRLRRPGSGSELLDLRDYLPGDPPKTIAWKVSARRDRLITKEFESEVPVRCTLFVDSSSSVRVPISLGGSDKLRCGKSLDHLVEVAAGVLHANSAVRDLTGIYLFDECEWHGIAPDRGDAHRAACLRLLAEAAARRSFPSSSSACTAEDMDRLLPLAYSFVAEVYPELLRPAVNSSPWTVTWLEGDPVDSSSPRRGWLELLHRRKDSLRRWCWWSSFWALVLPIALLAARVAFRTPRLDGLVVASTFLAPLASMAIWSATMFLFGVDAATGWRRRRRNRWRKQLSAILSMRYGLTPGGVAALFGDDAAFSTLMLRFLNDHQVPYTLPLYTSEGRYSFAAPEKVSVLAQALVRAVNKGRDNELFVLLVDLLELDDALDPLLRAARVALSRHHQVILLCPWPPGLELPSPSTERMYSSKDSDPATDVVGGKPRFEIASLDHLTTRRFHRAYHRLRRTFARLGVAVLCAAGDEPVPLILSRLERLRGMRGPHS